MPSTGELCLDAATGLSLGAREAQEDAVLCDVPQGGASGIIVLADGLGGHVAGALASRIAVTTALDELAAQRNAQGRLATDIPGRLVKAARAANRAILAHACSNPETRGMGATLLLVIVDGGRLFWLSVGDSPLFLLRGGAIRQLNEVHSLAPQFDPLARAGEMDPGIAAIHPDRSCLTSALGFDPLRRIDCPQDAFELAPGDLLVAASDGILTLSPETMATTLSQPDKGSATDLVDRLLRKVEACGAREQDNLSISILRIFPDTERIAKPRQRWARRLFPRVCLLSREPSLRGRALCQDQSASTSVEGSV
ncbi:PP2C family protein-serine/threonine phosphatase [Aliiruegeria lutimaris]|uniref:Serine/threonine protein phosphatase PrpC n=1 Tax=Aliiruegeria lutimaris TaxID=571298 RepID=A0A1G8VXC5_9RHOB|nr:protein phosphatase 2C domain-containing protein [Aliiruegeria lutimaris]SDJ70748.1 Serine/threonine protein phosphatase PrpC [Aliiruegeria lutimaris]